MTSVASASVCKLISNYLLSGIDEHLVIGAVCRRDYDKHARYNNDALQLPIDPANPDLGNANFRLRLESTTIEIPNVGDVIFDNSLLKPDCDRVLEILGSRVERELLASLGEFKAVVGNEHSGITPAVLDEADRVLFDAGANPAFLVTGEYGWRQIERSCGGRAGALEVCSPSPEDEPFLRTNAVFDRSAVCLVTRRLVQSSPNPVVHAETEDIGFTITTLEKSDGKALTVGIHLLFAAGITRNEYGVRIPIPATGLVQRPLESDWAADPVAPNVSMDPCSGDPLTVLSATAANPLISRFRATLDSLAESIPSSTVRLATALRLLRRTDGVTVEQLLDCCGLQQLALHDKALEFVAFMDGRRRTEITAREISIQTVEAEMQELRDRLAEADGKRTRLFGEIEQQNNLLLDREEEFEAALSIVKDDVKALEEMLITDKILTVGKH